MISLAPDYLFDGENFLSDMLLVADQDGKVLSVEKSLNSKKEGRRINGILSPGFVNSHLHLELSAFLDKIDRNTGLPRFISQLQSQRSNINDPERIRKAERDMWESGTVAAADICNTADTLQVKNDSEIKWHSLIELFGFREDSSDKIFYQGKSLQEDFFQSGQMATLTPHSPYSVSEKLLEKIISDTSPGGIISVHNQESESEEEFLFNQKGKLAEMLTGFGLDPASASIRGSHFPEYIVDSVSKNIKILLVHNTFTGEETLEKVKNRKNVTWCMCPRANLYIEGRLPDIPMFYEKGLPVVFGTDSLASNESLDLFEEIKITSRHFPGISLNELFSSITSVSAEFWSFKGMGRMVKDANPGFVIIEGVDVEKGLISNDAQATRLDLKSL